MINCKNILINDNTARQHCDGLRCPSPLPRAPKQQKQKNKKPVNRNTQTPPKKKQSKQNNTHKLK